MFRTSVHECVEESLTTRQPLFVYLSDDTAKSTEFLEKYLPTQQTDLVNSVNSKFIPLKLVQNTVDFGFFLQIFPQVTVPSFHIVSQGQVLDIITNDTGVDEFASKIGRITAMFPGSTGPAVSSPAAPVSSSSGTQTGTSLSHVNATIPNNTNNDIQEVSTQDRDATVEPTTDNTAVAQSLANTPASSDNNRALSNSPALNSTNEVSNREQTVSKHLAEVKELRRQKQKEKDRLRALINADKKERISQQRQSITPEPTVSKVSDTATSKKCTLAIKLFDGSSIKHDFEVDQTLNDVRTWLDKETVIIPDTGSIPSFATNTGPNHYVFHRPTLPRATFTDEQEFMKLIDLDLCPRSALILKPIFNQTVSSFPKEKGSILKSVGSTISKVGNALYSFFDYGVDDPHHYHDDHDDDDDGPEYDRPRSPIGDARSSGLDAHSSIDETASGITSPILSIHDNPSVTSLINTDGYRSRAASNPRQQFHSPNLQSTDTDAYVSPFVSRPGTPLNRLHTVHTLDKKDDDINTYNGNSVNLNAKDTNESD